MFFEILKNQKIMSVLKGTLQVILNIWASMKVFQGLIADYNIVTSLLVNIWTYFYDNQYMECFECKEFSFDKPLAIIHQQTLKQW